MVSLLRGAMRGHVPILLAMAILGVSSQLARWLKQESLQRAAMVPASTRPQMRQVIVSHGFVRISVDVPMPVAPLPPPLMPLPLTVYLHKVYGSPPLTQEIAEDDLQWALNYTTNAWSALAALNLDIAVLRDTINPGNDVKLRQGLVKESAREAALARYLPCLPGENNLHVFLLGSALPAPLGWSRRMYVPVPATRERLAQQIAQAVGKVLSLRTPSTSSCDKLCPAGSLSPCNLMCPTFSAQPSLARTQVERARTAARTVPAAMGARVLGPGVRLGPTNFAKPMAVVFLGDRVSNASNVARARFTVRCSETEPFAFKSMVLLLELTKAGNARHLAAGTLGRINLRAGMERPGLSKLREVPQRESESCPLRAFEVVVDPPASIQAGSRVGVGLSAPEAQLALAASKTSSRASALVAQRPFADVAALSGLFTVTANALDKTTLLLNVQLT